MRAAVKEFPNDYSLLNNLMYGIFALSRYSDNIENPGENIKNMTVKLFLSEKKSIRLSIKQY